MGISLKLGKPKLKLFGRKKKNILQKLTLQKGKTKNVKITKKELTTGLAVVGSAAAIVATGGIAAGGLAAGIASATGIAVGTVATTAGYVALAGGIGSSLLATGTVTASSALNASSALLNNPQVQKDYPIAKDANTAVNTGLNYYNQGSGIAETLGIKPPSLGTTSQEFFSLMSNSEQTKLDNALKPTPPKDIFSMFSPDKSKSDRALNIPQNKPTPPAGGMTLFKDPINDPSHPLYIPPAGQQGTTKIPSPDRPPAIAGTNNSIGIIVGIGLLGYLFMNKKGKK
jgi:hypothetical protein